MQPQVKPITVGADPEFFLLKPDGNPIPSCGLIGGTKDKPIPLPKSKFGVSYQEDNVTVEYGFNPITSNENVIHGMHLYDQVQRAFNEISNFVGAKGYVVSQNPELEFSKEQLASAQAQTFGCDPDLLAYEGGARRLPIDPKVVGNWRFAGGHIHIGYDRAGTEIPSFAMIQLIEYFAYLRYLSYDGQRERRKYYGLAGLYREKDYGVEYRTPSNFWIFGGNRGTFITQVANVAHQVTRTPKRAQEIYFQVDWPEVQKAINNSDNYLAQEMARMRDIHWNLLTKASE